MNKNQTFSGQIFKEVQQIDLAQTASWAEFKNVQNLHKSNVTPLKNKPLLEIQQYFCGFDEKIFQSLCKKTFGF